MDVENKPKQIPLTCVDHTIRYIVFHWTMIRMYGLLY